MKAWIDHNIILQICKDSSSIIRNNLFSANTHTFGNIIRAKYRYTTSYVSGSPTVHCISLPTRWRILLQCLSGQTRSKHGKRMHVQRILKGSTLIWREKVCSCRDNEMWRPTNWRRKMQCGHFRWDERRLIIYHFCPVHTCRWWPHKARKRPRKLGQAKQHKVGRGLCGENQCLVQMTGCTYLLTHFYHYCFSSSSSSSSSSHWLTNCSVVIFPCCWCILIIASMMSNLAYLPTY